METHAVQNFELTQGRDGRVVLSFTSEAFLQCKAPVVSFGRQDAQQIELVAQSSDGSVLTVSLLTPSPESLEALRYARDKGCPVYACELSEEAQVRFAQEVVGG